MGELISLKPRVASEKVARVQVSLEGESLEYFLIYGRTPKDILRKLTGLSGRPALPPQWLIALDVVYD